MDIQLKCELCQQIILPRQLIERQDDYYVHVSCAQKAQTPHPVVSFLDRLRKAGVI